MSDQDAASLLAQGYISLELDESQVGPVMPRRVVVGARSVLLCRDGARIFAVDEICPHKQKSMAFGVVMDGKLTCPHHQYQFDLETGRCSQRRCEPIQSYPVAVIQGQLFVKI